MGKKNKKLAKAIKLAGKYLPFDGDLLTSLNFDLEDFGSSGKTLRRFIRKNPAATVLLAAGLGFVLAKSQTGPTPASRGWRADSEEKRRTDDTRAAA